ncbi:MAG: hypothetical protein M1300_05875 [Epsilonproteobacteria bacterium]|nr:hypothetical protein [Campylobacterota bacterium]
MGFGFKWLVIWLIEIDMLVSAIDRGRIWIPFIVIAMWLTWKFFKSDLEKRNKELAEIEAYKEKLNIPKDYNSLEVGRIQKFNEILQKTVDTEEKILVFYKEDGSTYQDIKFVVKGTTFEIKDITKFVLMDDENLKAYYATQNAVKKGVGKNNSTLSDISQYKQIQAAKRLLLEFSNTELFILTDLNHTFIKKLESMLMEIQ